jgi:hypothetical protein
MIDSQTETILTFADAAKTLPKRRAGKKPNIATFYRWISQGVKGIRLEYIVIGGTRCTSREALQRFFDRLTELAESGRAPIPQPAKLSAQRQREIAAAEKRLQAAGI